MSKTCRSAAKAADSNKTGAFEAGLNGAEGETFRRDGLLSPTPRQPFHPAAANTTAG